MITDRIFIITFVVTAIFDVILQLIANDALPILNFVKSFDWFISLKPYFKQHTPLAAALIAGFVGYTTQMLIYALVGFPLYKSASTIDYVMFVAASVVLSGVGGFLMQKSKLFPILEKTYYKELGTTRAFFTDIYSGIIVQLTAFALVNYFDIFF